MNYESLAVYRCLRDQQTFVQYNKSLIPTNLSQKKHKLRHKYNHTLHDKYYIL